MYEKLELYIDGTWRQGSAGISEPVINPATEEVLAEVPHASAADLEQALDCAEAAFGEWRATSPWVRAGILKQAARLMVERKQHIGETMTLEQGKTLGDSIGEVERCAEATEWFAEEGKRAYGRLIPSRFPGQRGMVIPEPVGVSLALTPWNFPALMPVRKIAAGLAAGCPVIVKPSEETPGTGVAIVRCFVDAGVPKGVLNLVFGVPDDVSRHLIGSGRIRKLSFTGSIPVGKHLARLAADHMVKCTLELGGHSPVLVFEDANLDTVIGQMVPFKYRNAGQVCISPTRFYVHESIHDAFVTRFTDAAKALKIGNGMDKETQMGPMANARRITAMEEFVQDARDKGVEITTGGNRTGNQGYFFEPTVMADVPEEAMIMSKEPFGPLAPISKFSTFEDVIKRANQLPYGLASYCYTADQKRADQLAEVLETGMVGVNNVMISQAETPFGGVKESGYGQEGGIEGLNAYLNHKYVSQMGM
ncbi:MAG: NAD-dependent succinate-semialdehyde dehydrogenase [Proteobacteria bacterium]|nr:NAD-dependent succinate-semialdehyde dehydrogenase [Pseudomonadota bacterium]